MRNRITALVLGAGLLLVVVAFFVVRSEEQANPRGSTTTGAPGTSSPDEERDTADLLVERISAIPGFAEKCGQVAFEVGVEVFDKTDRLVDAITMEKLPCREDILVGMVASAQDSRFTDDQLTEITTACNRESTGTETVTPCGLLIGAVSVMDEPTDALVRCANVPDTEDKFTPPQRVVCVATYLSLLLETRGLAPEEVPGQVLDICVTQPDNTRKLCAESVGAALLTPIRSLPAADPADQLAKGLPLLPGLLERCRELTTLITECETSVLAAMMVRYPVGDPASGTRSALCAAFSETVRVDCETRTARPDSDFAERPSDTEDRDLPLLPGD